MSRIALALFCLIPLLLLNSCQPKPTPPIVYQRNASTPPAPQVVEKAGTYALFPGDGVQPLDGSAVYLHPGDSIGFKSQEGKIVGFYTLRPTPQQEGVTKTIPLDGILTSDYSWKYVGEAQP